MKIGFRSKYVLLSILISAAAISNAENVSRNQNDPCLVGQVKFPDNGWYVSVSIAITNQCNVVQSLENTVVAFTSQTTKYTDPLSGAEKIDPVHITETLDSGWLGQNQFILKFKHLENNVEQGTIELKDPNHTDDFVINPHQTINFKGGVNLGDPNYIFYDTTTANQIIEVTHPHPQRSVFVKNPFGIGFAWHGGIVGAKEQDFSFGINKYISTENTDDMLFAVRYIKGEVAGTAHFSCIFPVKDNDIISAYGTTYNPIFKLNDKPINPDTDCINQISVSNTEGSYSFKNLSIAGGDAKSDLTVGSTYNMYLTDQKISEQQQYTLHVEPVFSTQNCDIPVKLKDKVAIHGWYPGAIKVEINGIPTATSYCSK